MPSTTKAPDIDQSTTAAAEQINSTPMPSNQQADNGDQYFELLLKHLQERLQLQLEPQVSILFGNTSQK